MKPLRTITNSGPNWAMLKECGHIVGLAPDAFDEEMPFDDLMRSFGIGSRKMRCPVCPDEPEAA